MLKNQKCKQIPERNIGRMHWCRDSLLNQEWWQTQERNSCRKQNHRYNPLNRRSLLNSGKDSYKMQIRLCMLLNPGYRQMLDIGRKKRHNHLSRSQNPVWPCSCIQESGCRFPNRSSSSERHLRTGTQKRIEGFACVKSRLEKRSFGPPFGDDRKERRKMGRKMDPIHSQGRLPGLCSIDVELADPGRFRSYPYRRSICQKRKFRTGRLEQ